MEEKKEFKYDAFISYRHCELDKFVAENLHKLLETYNLPKSAKQKLGITGKTVRRIFKDREELPLTSNLEDPIIEGLKESKYLIVICSPRLKDSLWCKKEIETFKKLRGRKNIFCVLIEGEPSDSFPEEVLTDEITVTKNGKKVKEKVLVEPLAADVRADSKRKILKLIKEERVRLLAPMYGLDYDDLKQRHKQREQRRIITTLLAITVGSILFTVYSLAMFIKINMQQNVLSEYQALSLAEKSENALKTDDRKNAIKYAYQALTDFDDILMPYTEEAEYALSESLGIYDAGASYKAIKEIKTQGVVDYIKTSSNRKYGAIYDESETITLFNTKTLKEIATYKTNDSFFNEFDYTFIGNDYLAFINELGNINIVNMEGKIIKEIKKENDSFIGIQGDSNGKYLAYAIRKKAYIYDIESDKIIESIKTEDDITKRIFFQEDSNYLFITTEKGFLTNESLTVNVIKTSDGTLINSTEFEVDSISKIITKDDNAYILLNKGLGDNLEMITVSYNYINGSINWDKSFEGRFGSFITKSYKEGINNIAVVSYDEINVLDENTGDIVEVFNAKSKVINIYAFTAQNTYLTLLSNGAVNYLSMDNRQSIELIGKYEFNLEEYTNAVISEDGFLLSPKHENRVILYEAKTNKNIKEEDIVIDYVKDDSFEVKDRDQLIEKYNMKNKSLIDKIFYDTDKKILFVNYANKDLAIYDVKGKKLLKALTNVGTINHYFGKDKYDRIYVGDGSNAYIIDNKYNKVGHIKGLRKLERDKVIIASNQKYYSLKIYTLADILKEAKSYLKIK